MSDIRQDGRVFIWTCEDPTGNTWTPKLLHKFVDVVWHVSWSITGNILAVSGGDNKVTQHTIHTPWRLLIPSVIASVEEIKVARGENLPTSMSKNKETNLTVIQLNSDTLRYIYTGARTPISYTRMIGTFS